MSQSLGVSVPLTCVDDLRVVGFVGPSTSCFHWGDCALLFAEVVLVEFDGLRIGRLEPLLLNLMPPLGRTLGRVPQHAPDVLQSRRLLIPRYLCRTGHMIRRYILPAEFLHLGARSYCLRRLQLLGC